MTYTVYIPDAERGPTSYTQRQFATMKALARWAMDAALEEPAVAPKQYVADIATSMLQSPAMTGILEQFGGITPAKVAEQLRDPAIVELVSQIEKTVPSFLKPGAIIGLGTEATNQARDTNDKHSPSIGWQVQDLAAKEKALDVTFKTRSEADRSLRIDGHLAPEPTPAVELWEVDTDEWFTDASASEWATPLRERDWTTVAKLYFDEVGQLFETAIGNHVADIRNVLSAEDKQWFVRLARTYPQIFAENLFPETQVRWDLLPASFSAAATKWLENNPKKFGAPVMTATHRFATDAFAILSFLRTGQRHTSWKEIMPEAGEGLAWGASAAEATAEKLLSAWWSGAKSSDAVREFVLQLIVMRYFKQTGPAATTVGSAEFLTTYMERVRSMGASGVLPAGFLDWATRGTSFKHCKTALTAMGIASVRRADGQKYTNLAEIKVEDDEVWVFENDLGFAGDWMAPVNATSTTWPGDSAPHVSLLSCKPSM